ncbi:MAG: hypothetical protein HRT89_21070 [Lentisphaeria bacterium]|nr:hypothetical protein [Lentisphaeria bacterium]NQZ70552.1 hypothetical protein [Lentisphaeria bacterium]
MKNRIIFIIFVSPVIVAAVLCLNYVVSKKDRVHFEQRASDLQTVYDQLVRYELKHKTLPKKLSDLVPKYLREEQLISDGKELYIFDREKRTIALASKAEIDGLYKSDRPAIVLKLPDTKIAEPSSYETESALMETELDNLNTKSIKESKPVNKIDHGNKK